MEQLLNTDLELLIPTLTNMAGNYLYNHNIITNPKDIVVLAMAVGLGVLNGTIVWKQVH